MPEISIILPVYNVEKYLARCIGSILRQTFSDFEVICVNDGSTDGSLAVLEQQTAGDRRFIIISQPNQGLSVARNNGLQQANGKYIYFLDSDDAIHPQLLEIAVEYIKRYAADLVSFGYAPSDGTAYAPTSIDKARVNAKELSNPLRAMPKKIMFNVWTKLYSRRLLDGIEFIPHIHFEDYPHTYAVLARRPKTVLLDVKLYYYTRNQNSISKQKGSPQQIKDYHCGLKYINAIYSASALADERLFLIRTLMPLILKHQIGRCRRADKSVRPAMYEALAAELRELSTNGMLGFRGHKLRNLLTYLWLIKKGR